MLTAARGAPRGPKATQTGPLGTHSHPTSKLGSVIRRELYPSPQTPKNNANRNLSRSAYRTCSMKWYNSNKKISRYVQSLHILGGAAMTRRRRLEYIYIYIYGRAVLLGTKKRPMIKNVEWEIAPYGLCRRCCNSGHVVGCSPGTLS